jgi:hypothetical protein
VTATLHRHPAFSDLQEIADIVYRIFRDDFIAFGYPREAFPDAAGAVTDVNATHSAAAAAVGGGGGGGGGVAGGIGAGHIEAAQRAAAAMAMRLVDQEDAMLGAADAEADSAIQARAATAVHLCHSSQSESILLVLGGLCLCS